MSHSKKQYCKQRGGALVEVAVLLALITAIALFSVRGLGQKSGLALCNANRSWHDAEGGWVAESCTITAAGQIQGIP
jgi:hypothetical protein